MFTWLNKQGVKGDCCFIIQRTGRFTAEYRDKGKVVTLDVEDGTPMKGEPCIIVDPDAFRHWDGETATIPSEEQAQMFENLARLRSSRDRSWQSSAAVSRTSEECSHCGLLTISPGR